MTAAKKQHAKRGRKRLNAKDKRPGRTAPGKLTPTGGNTAEAKQQATAAVRRRRAMDLYVYQRLTMQQIADVLTSEGLPCTNATVCNDIHRAFDEAKSETAAAARHGIDAEIRRLDQIDRQLMPVAMGNIANDYATVMVGKGKQRRAKRVPVPVKTEPRTRLQMDALAQLRRNGESRRKMLGLDKQSDEGLISTQQLVSTVRSLVSEMLVIAGENIELRKQLGNAMRKHFGVLNGEVVEQG